MVCEASSPSPTIQRLRVTVRGRFRVRVRISVRVRNSVRVRVRARVRVRTRVRGRAEPARGQLAQRRRLSAPDRASGCSDPQPLDPRVR